MERRSWLKRRKRIEELRIKEADVELRKEKIPVFEGLEIKEFPPSLCGWDREWLRAMKIEW